MKVKIVSESAKNSGLTVFEIRKLVNGLFDKKGKLASKNTLVKGYVHAFLKAPPKQLHKAAEFGLFDGFAAEHVELLLNDELNDLTLLKKKLDKDVALDQMLNNLEVPLSKKKQFLKMFPLDSYINAD